MERFWKSVEKPAQASIAELGGFGMIGLLVGVTFRLRIAVRGCSWR